MRLPIISFTVFAVCFGLFGCTNGDEVSSMQPSLSAIQNDLTNVLLLVTESSKIFILQHSTKGVSITEYDIEGNSKLPEDYKYVTDLTSTCLDDNIYILKHYSPNSVSEFTKRPSCSKKLDVIRYNESNKFERIDDNKDIFDDAISIASDNSTGKIYWIDNIVDMEFSIKNTDKSFKKFEYIIFYDSKISMRKLQVYRSKIFFSSVDSFWYTNDSLDSTPYPLFSSEVTFKNIIDFTIDYLTDKLCWIDYFYDNRESHLKCVVIGNSHGQLTENDIVTIAIDLQSDSTFVAFNNTFYWTANDNNTLKLYFKNGDDRAVEIADLPENCLLSIVPSICPSTKKLIESIVPKEVTTKTKIYGCPVPFRPCYDPASFNIWFS